MAAIDKLSPAEALDLAEEALLQELVGRVAQWLMRRSYQKHRGSDQTAATAAHRTRRAAGYPGRMPSGSGASVGLGVQIPGDANGDGMGGGA